MVGPLAVGLWILASPATGASPAVDPPPPLPGSSFFVGRGLTPAERKVLADFGAALNRYESESREYQQEVQAWVEQRYQAKRAILADSYEHAIRDHEVIERQDRLDAIAQFEEFLRRYPDEPRYTPDVIFRLAELDYERSSDEHALAMRAYEDKLKTLPTARLSEAGPEPTVSFATSIALYRKLLAAWPGYRLDDAVTYLLGYCLEKQDDLGPALAAYHQLIARFPQSRFSPEAWVRIGEYYFDQGTDAGLLQAAQAYEAAVRDRTHPLYDKALYKLGWTYYRLDRFDDAVARFLALADFYQQQAKAQGKDQVGGDLREEALQYTAISFADDKWGSLAKAQAWFQRLGGRPYEGEIYRRMGDVYFDETHHDLAIAAYRAFLAKDPLSREGPKVEEKIVQAYQRDRKLEEAFQEAIRLEPRFGPGSDWYRRWRHDPDVLAQAQELTERSLSSSAIYHHQQALADKQAGRAEEARAELSKAAEAYGAYLRRFPRSKHAYQMTFYEAECLFDSDQFAAAAQAYEAVRDSTEDNKYLPDATYAAVLAWQKALELERAQGRLPVLKVLKAKERPPGAPVEPIPLAEPEQRFVSASDAFLRRMGGDPRSPDIAYKAAELLYVHNQFAQARQRFEAILQRYPRSADAPFAINLIVETYLAAQDWKSVEEVSARLAKQADPHGALYRELVHFKLAGRFKRADELMAKGQLEQAAQKYLALVEEDPHNEFADKALNNAAVCEERSRRFGSALALYERIVREYPKSTLADAALFRLGVDAENAYDFDKAVATYQQLVERYPTSKEAPPALFDEARLLEGEQRYGDAARAFTRYAQMFPNAEDAPQNLLRAALIDEKRQDFRQEVQDLGEVVRRFAGQPAREELVVQALQRTGDAQLKLADPKAAQRAWRQATEDFDRAGLDPERSPAAAEAAAQAAFQLAEAQFRDFDALTISGRGNRLAASFQAKHDAVKRVNDAYAAVFKYKRLEWTLAALYRRGNALEHFGNTILDTPVPDEVKKLGDEAVAAYQDTLSQQTAALEDKAVEAYAATLAEARKSHISDQWTRRTLESLSRYRPKEYPVLKEPKAELLGELTFPTGLLGVDGPVRAQADDKLGAGEDK